MKMSSYFRLWRPLSPPLHKISNNILIYLTSYRILAPPPHLPVIKIVMCCGVWGRGGGGRQNLTKDNGAPPFCHYDSKVLWRLGGGALGGAKILQEIMTPPSLCH